jgi:hypothetical protein
MCTDEHFPEPGGVARSTQVQKFEVSLPSRRLRCACGHWLETYDFELIEPGIVRTICSRCHQELQTIELNVEVFDGP